MYLIEKLAQVLWQPQNWKVHENSLEGTGTPKNFCESEKMLIYYDLEKIAQHSILEEKSPTIYKFHGKSPKLTKTDAKWTHWRWGISFLIRRQVP